MRAIVTLLVIVVIVGIIGVATGFFKFSGTSGELPKVAVSGGALPTVDADAGSVAVGTKKEDISVPDVKVDTKKTTVDVPVIGVRKPD